MKKNMMHKSELDIRFISMDSENPNAITKTFSDKNIELVRKRLHEQLGHLSGEIGKTKGHINIYTHEDVMIGQPQFVNFSMAVWDKINYPSIKTHNEKYEVQTERDDDYLDHTSYLDV